MKALKPYLTLYWKEVKFISGLGLLLLAITAGGMIYLSIADYFRYPNPLNPLLNKETELLLHKSFMYAARLVYASVFMLPIILVYSLNIEQKSKTHYLLLSLPVSKRLIIFNKFLVVMSIGMILAFIIETVPHIIEPIGRYVFYKSADEEFLKYYARGNTYIFQKLLEVKQNLVFPYQKVLENVIRQFSLRHFWRIISSWGFSQIFVYCSIVCIAQGVMVSFKRHRTVVWIGTFILTVTVYSFFSQRLYSIINSIFSVNLSNSLYVSLYPFVAGVLILTPGLYLFEKYCDV